MPKPIIEHIISMGDSLSDPGRMAHKKLGGLIPMDGLSGLKGKSPKGAFTNGYVWDTDFGTDFVEERIIRTLKRKGEDSTEIADEVIVHDPKVENSLHNLKLDDYRRINFAGRDFIRYYDEGGLTSYDYSGRITTNIKCLVTEKVVSNLDEKRSLLLADDNARAISAEHKKRTLITEWSGANDLITVNNEPSKEEAEKAVLARIKNAEELIKAGYYHFVLFNLPDLSLTPHFYRLGEKEQANAREVCNYYNQLLQQKVTELSEKHPNCSINTFDVNKIFTDAYYNPQKYQLDSAKIHSPYLESKDFKLNSNKTSPAPGYMFWDDKHPSAHVHKILAEKFYDEFSEKYHFSAPHESLLTQFRENYGQKWKDDKEGWFGFFRTTHINYKTESLTLENILKHALEDGGKRTREVITELGWIDNEGKLIAKNPSLVAAMKKLHNKENEHTLEEGNENPCSLF
ncbi:SGNH/GDSL hydrolase family protein [Legionella clemsonensis]|uniref:Phosphatidylcholine-sterol acyltransferase n=1 Tax=Legionella clemsonensis TaxID=1867846 RepID=A0A222P0G9_9GAMM|nr:SGNH/GDSL hydrolase family protein [Legionella clemsonensis]ASQ45340.1 Phosphatidylcholine-sterol acyltransferase precursor [Legionella clemsonensis]